jgi:hypothetical protein
MDREHMTVSTDMPVKARAYWLLVVVTGVSCALLTLHFQDFRHEDLRRVSLYIFAALVASGLKTRLPGILVTLSVNYIVIMAALLSLNLGAAMIVGVVSAVGQCCICASRTPRWFQVVFSASAMALPILGAESALHSHLLSLEDPSGCLNVLAASVAYFLMNTIIVAGIVGLTSGKKLSLHWRQSYLWTSFHYLVGGGIAGALHFLNVVS